MGAVVADFDPGGGRSEGVGTFFKAVTQAVFLFGAETWVLTPRMERALSSFQHRVERRLTGRHPRRQGGWDLVVPIIVGINGGSRLKGDRDIHHEESEHSRAVYFDVTNSGTL